MSENRSRFKLSDGRTVSVPSENAATAQKIWKQKGLTFEPLNAEQVSNDAKSAEQIMRRGDAAMGEVGPAEAASKNFGQGALAGAGVKLAATSDAFQNWMDSKMPGMVDPITGDPAETQGRGMRAPLKDRAAYEREHKARLAQTRARQPAASISGSIAGGLALGAALPIARAAPGAGILRSGAAGLGNIAADTALASTTAANEAPEGEAWDAAKGAATPAAAMSAAFRAPRGAVVGARGVRDAALTTLPAETAQAARTLTEPNAAGAAARAQAREGALSIDPQVRRVSSAIDDTEILSDSVRHDLRAEDFKMKDVEDAFVREMAPDVPNGGALKPPKAPGDMDFDVRGEPVHVSARAPGVDDTKRAAGSIPASPGAMRRKARMTTEGVTDAPLESAPKTRAIPPPAHKFDPTVAVAGGMGVAEQMRNELAALLEHADDMAPPARQAVRTLHKRAENLIEKISPHLKSSSNPQENARAAARAFVEIDNFKRSLGSYAAQLRGRDTRFTQQALRGMYENTLRPHLEDAAVWGEQAATEQRAINSKWHPYLNERERFERTVLTPDAVRPGADPFERVPDADRRKVAGVLSNAGSAAGDIDELSMREGLRTNAELVEQAARMTGASPALKQRAQRVGQDVNEILAELDRTKQARGQARAAQDVSKASPAAGRVVNAVGAAEAAVRGSKPLTAVANAAGATARAAGYATEPARKTAAEAIGVSASRETAAETDAMADPKYGRMIALKPPAERAFTIGVLSSQDPEFRARQREAAQKRSKQNGQ